MKKYKMIMFLILMSMMLVLPTNLRAEMGMRDRDMKGERGITGMRYYDWFPSLDLDENVLRKMQGMRLEYREKIIDLRNQVEKKKLEMEKVLIEKKFDFNKLLSIHDEISDLRQKISRQRLEQRIEMYKLVPDDKKEEAKSVFFRNFSGKRHKGSVRPGCPVGK